MDSIPVISSAALPRLKSNFNHMSEIKGESTTKCSAHMSVALVLLIQE